MAGLLFLGVVLLAAPSGAQERPFLDIRVFARVGQPGQPEPIAVSPVDRRVYVGTNQQAQGDTVAPSKIFAYSRGGELVDEITLKGQPLEQEHGIQGLAFDGVGRLYALDRSATPRVVRINPRTGQQGTWARFSDVPSCSEAPPGAQCSAATTDQAPAPDYAAFGPDGRLYVTDINQALIWRVSRKGGQARVWLTNPAFEGPYGPNGIQFVDRGRTLVLAVTLTVLSSGAPTGGAVYEIPVNEDGSPGEAVPLWQSGPLEAPDGFAIARSGNIYLALAGAAQLVVLSANGKEIDRVPRNASANSSQEIPFDGPASVAFLGARVLVSNHSPLAGNPDSWAVLDVYSGEHGRPLYYPRPTRVRRRR